MQKKEAVTEMYLSRIEIENKSLEGQKNVENINKLHGIVNNSLGIIDDRKNTLWRVDKLGTKDYLLIQSEDVPDLTLIERQLSPQGAKGAVKNNTEYLNTVKKGDKFRFKVIANPIKAIPKWNEKRNCFTRRKKALNWENDQRTWFIKKAKREGFIVKNENFRISQPTWRTFEKGKKKESCHFLSAVFEGVLEVEDVEKFKKMLVEGFGRARSYGCALMTVARI